MLHFSVKKIAQQIYPWTHSTSLRIDTPFLFRLFQVQQVPIL